MSAVLECSSFHSVKGGVGKSTLAVIAALERAHERPEVPVYLVDMDLTGTSLADVLALCAPRSSRDDSVELFRAPSDHWSRAESLKRIDDRERLQSVKGRPEEAPEDVLSPSPALALREPRSVPFLNDFLLYRPEGPDSAPDVDVDALSWLLENGPPNLRVIPSSALPSDLQYTLPVIYDEEHCAFVEARLEHLLAQIASRNEQAVVVFDTPPTIPGLSRSVMSLGLRLARAEKETLSPDDGLPPALEDAKIEWDAFVVCTLDMQDLRSTSRWLSLRAADESRIVRPLINRAWPEDAQVQDHLRSLGLIDLEDAERFTEDARLQFFRDGRLPEAPPGRRFWRRT